MLLKKISKAKLDKILKSEFEYLKDAILNGKNPYHLFCLGTSVAVNSEIRMVVLRNVINNHSIFFNADWRSPKVDQLKKNNNAMALFYDSVRRVQLRLNCSAVINYDNKISKSIWEKTPLQSRKCYMGPFSPSDKLDNYHPNIPLNYLKQDPDKDISQNGYKNFCSIELKINKIDILQLHHDGHIRFEFDLISNQILYIAP